MVSVILELGFPDGSVVKKKKKSPAIQETQVQSLSLEDSLEKEMATHSCILAWDKEKQQRRHRKMNLSIIEGLSPR